MFPEYWGKLFEDENLKTTENQRLSPEGRQNVHVAFEKCLGHDLASHEPREFPMCLGHAFCLCLMRLGCLSCAPYAKSRGTTVTCRNSHYKYQPSSFRISRSELWQFKRKATLEIYESFYLLLDFLGYVFIFSNLFLVTTCN